MTIAGVDTRRAPTYGGTFSKSPQRWQRQSEWTFFIHWPAILPRNWKLTACISENLWEDLSNESGLWPCVSMIMPQKTLNFRSVAVQRRKWQPGTRVSF